MAVAEIFADGMQVFWLDPDSSELCCANYYTQSARFALPGESWIDYANEFDPRDCVDEDVALRIADVLRMNTIPS